ncbi:hypothetical protein KSP39_PZI012663 [Platanthera zijinensis]|uniref:Uncharacterized protein n=1 Tax=Platanthera zijinensis TaxID=2320716 RepID=A0AAP0BFZ8_9ASPA
MSPGPGHCDPLFEEAPLLPKLRGPFADFSCLTPLGSTHLCRFRHVGLLKIVRAFPGSMAWGAIAPDTRTLARGISSTPEKAGSPCILEPITIFRPSSVPRDQQGRRDKKFLDQLLDKNDG